MLAGHSGGLQDIGPPVGKGGYCDGILVVVISHVVWHGGENTVVSAASGGVDPMFPLGSLYYSFPPFP